MLLTLNHNLPTRPGSVGVPGPVGEVRMRLRRGFTFTEILFAVILLGIGFIMLAAMFPVAIQQTQLNGEETAGASVGAAGAKYVEQIASEATLPPNGGLTPLPLMAWRQLQKNMICAQDRRFAWVPFYRRVAGQNYAQVIILAVQARNTGTFTDADLQPQVLSAGPNLSPRSVTVNSLLHFPARGADVICFSPQDGALVAEGAYVVISGGGASRVYRIGMQVSPDGSAWELAPGGNMLVDGTGNVIDATQEIKSPVGAYVLGRGCLSPSGGLGSPSSVGGQAMDVGIYSTYVMIK